MWEDLTMMMLDCQISIKTFFRFFTNQIRYEFQEPIIRRAFEIVDYTLRYFVDEKDSPMMRADIFYLMLNWLIQDAFLTDRIREVIVGNIFRFVASSEQLRICLDWLENGSIPISAHEQHHSLELKLDDKLTILELLYADRDTQENRPSVKAEFFAKVLNGLPMNDALNDFQLRLGAMMPCQGTTLMVWQLLTQPFSKDSLHSRVNLLQAFQKFRDHQGLLLPVYIEYERAVADLIKY